MEFLELGVIDGLLSMLKEFWAVVRDLPTVVKVGTLLLSGVMALWRPTQKILRNIHRRWEVKHYFFYPQSRIKKLIARDIHKPIEDSPFIDSSLYHSEGCEGFVGCYGRGKLLRIKADNRIFNKEIPYREVIDYMDGGPRRRIKIDDPKVSEYAIPSELEAATRSNLEAFWEKKGHRKKGVERRESRVLRMKSLRPTSAGGYECGLQEVGYFYAARTSLTIDLPLGNSPFGSDHTMRTLDFCTPAEECEESGKLRAIESSLLANVIGVSAVWCMTSCHKSRGYEHQFFLKPRDRKTAIFSEVLGTVSGSVKPPKENEFDDIEYLEEYATQEMRRIFGEIGYDDYQEKVGILEDEIEIRLLSFTREFARGGQPQFFFLIRTPVISNNDMRRYFKRMSNGRRKFNDKFLSKRRGDKYRLSSETATNFLYALRYLQRNLHLNYIDLDSDVVKK